MTKSILFILLGLILTLVLMYFASEGLVLQENTIISTPIIIGTHLVTGLGLLGLLCLHSRIRKILLNLSVSNKVLFLFFHLMVCILVIGDAVSYIYLNANKPTSIEKTSTIKCPILSFRRCNSKIDRTYAKISIDGVYKQVSFPNSNEYKDLSKAQHIILTITPGRLGYDYIVNKEIEK